jgi:RNA polymerase sigma-70 factor (ECF subfamily)
VGCADSREAKRRDVRTKRAIEKRRTVDLGRSLYRGDARSNQNAGERVLESMIDSPADEAAAVLLAQSGDREALDRLLRGIERPLYGYVARLTGNPETAKDVLQETFLRICRKLGWLHDPALFRPWAFRIASREAFRMTRRERGRREVDLPDPAPEAPSPAPEPWPASLDLPAALDEVSPASRAVLILHYIHDMKLEEVSDVLAIPLGTTKSRLAYGLRLLRRSLEPEVP